MSETQRPAPAPAAGIASHTEPPEGDSYGDVTPSAVFFSPRRVVRTLIDREWLLIVCTVVFLMASGIGIVTPVLPIYARTYEVSAALVGLLLTTFGIGRIAVSIPAGHLFDRLGPKTPLILGPAVMASASVGVAISGTYELLLLFRFMQGVGSAIQMTGGYLAIAALAPREQLAKTTGIYQSSLLLGMSFGPWVGGWVAELFGFRAPFIGQAVLAAFAAVWAWRRFPHVSSGSRTDDRETVEPVRARLRSLFLNRNFVLVSLVSFIVFFARAGTKQTVLPLFGHDRLGLSIGTVGTVYAIITAFELMALTVAGGLSDRFGRKAMIVPSLTAAGLAFALIGSSQSHLAFVAGGVLLGLSTGIGAPSPAAYVADIAPVDGYGVSFGVFRTFADAGLIAGPLIAGVVADLWGLVAPFYVTATALIGIALLFALAAGKGEPRHDLHTRVEPGARGTDEMAG